MSLIEVEKGLTFWDVIGYLIILAIILALIKAYEEIKLKLESIMRIRKEKEKA